ncbi:MAG: acyltransferase family protein [Blastocatellia bacterium]
MNDSSRSLPQVLRASHDWIARQLSRVTSTGEVIAEVDGLRFIAISVVVFHHLMSIYLPTVGRVERIWTATDWFAATPQSWLVPFAYCGHFGVNLFFVISGFILALPFAKRAFNNLPAPNLKGYYLRRVTRIEPPYVICLLLLFFMMWVDKKEFLHLIPNLIASVFYLHGFVFGRESQINGVAWSLEVEIQFYIFVPFLVRLFRIQDARKRRLWLAGLILAFGVFSQEFIYPFGSARLRLTLFNFLHYFLAGFLLADFYLNNTERLKQKSYKWDLIALACAGFIIFTLWAFGHTYFLLPFVVAGMYAGCCLGKIANRIITWRWIVITGGMCYTIYLYHVPIISRMFWDMKSLSVASLPATTDFLRMCLLIVPTMFALCALLFVLAEKPFMRWSLTKRESAPMVSAVSAD